MKTILLLMFSICTITFAKAQTAGDFRSAASGNWSAAATWERFDGTTWAAATAAPVLADGAITVLTGHAVALDASMSIDSVFVQTGATLDVNTGLIVTVPVNTVGGLPATGIKVTGTMNVAGKILNQGQVGIGTGGIVNWNNGSEYEHAQNAGSIPVSTWNTGSTCNVTGSTSTSSVTNSSQNYFNFIWNCPSQGAGNTGLNFAGNVISGTMSVLNIGSGAINQLRFTTGTLGGGLPAFTTINKLIVNLGFATQEVTTSGSSGTFNYNYSIGDIVLNGGEFNLGRNSGATSTLTITGDLIIDGTTSTATISRRSATIASKIIFAKNGTQVFTRNGITNALITTSVNFEVASGAMVDLNNSNVTTAVTANTTPTFTVLAGGGLTTSAPGGFNDNFTSSSVRYFLNPAGNYGFNGMVSQSTGTRLQNDSSGVSALVQSPTNGFQMTCNNLIINNTGASADDIITLSKQFVINGSLILTDGLLLPSTTNTLTIPTTATIVGGNAGSYIAKRVSITTNSTNPLTIPLGKDGNYRPVTIIPTTTNATTWDAEYYSTGNANTGSITAPVTLVNAGEYWDIGRTGTANAAIQLPLSGAVPGATASDKIGIVHYKSSSWQWEGGSADLGTNTSGTLSTAVVTTFSPFAIGVLAPTVLPLTLLNFSASYNGSTVNLQWNTANELNVQKFAIQKSNDGNTFTTIGDVAATNGIIYNSYSYADNSALIGKVYYRLKTIDANGTFKYSNIVSINTKQGKNVQVYPNPASNVVTVALPKSNIATTIQLINTQGKIVQSTIVPANTVQTSMYIGDIAAGVYYISTSGTDKKSISFIKQ